LEILQKFSQVEKVKKRGRWRLILLWVRARLPEIKETANISIYLGFTMNFIKIIIKSYTIFLCVVLLVPFLVIDVFSRLHLKKIVGATFYTIFSLSISFPNYSNILKKNINKQNIGTNSTTPTKVVLQRYNFGESFEKLKFLLIHGHILVYCNKHRSLVPVHRPLTTHLSQFQPG